MTVQELQALGFIFSVRPGHYLIHLQNLDNFGSFAELLSRGSQPRLTLDETIEAARVEAVRLIPEIVARRISQ